MAASVAPGANAWEQIKGWLVGKIAPLEFQNWILRTAYDGIDGRSLKVSVQDHVTKEFIEQEFGEHIRLAIVNLGLPIDRVVYLPGADVAMAASDSTGAEPEFSSTSAQLNSNAVGGSRSAPEATS